MASTAGSAAAPALANTLKQPATNLAAVDQPTAVPPQTAAAGPTSAGTPGQPSAGTSGPSSTTTTGGAISIRSCTIGAWRLVGTDPDLGETYLVFGEDFTITGFGTRPACPDALAVLGTWRYDDQGQVTGEYVEERGGVRIVVDFQATVECGPEPQLLGTAKTDTDTYRFEAEPAVISP